MVFDQSLGDLSQQQQGPPLPWRGGNGLDQSLDQLAMADLPPPPSDPAFKKPADPLRPQPLVPQPRPPQQPAPPFPITSPPGSAGPAVFNQTIGKTHPAEAFRDTYFGGMYHPNIDMLHQKQYGRTQLTFGGDLYQGNNKVGFISRTLYPHEKEAHHDSLTVYKDYQNQGISKKLLAGQFQFYKQAGYKEVGVTAVDKGAYAWARAGFLPDSPEEWMNLRDKLRTRLNTMNIPQDEYTHISNMLSSNDPKTIWKIANLNTPYQSKYYEPQDNPTVGKHLLYSQSWTGKFDLKNEDQWRMHYVYTGQSPEQK